MVNYFRISSYIRKPFLIYDFAINFLIYEENFFFFFISVESNASLFLIGLWVVSKNKRERTEGVGHEERMQPESTVNGL